MALPGTKIHFADQAGQTRTSIVENVQLARDTYRVRLLAPELAERFVPGQFVMLRLAWSNDPLLGRPLALYDLVRDSAGRAIGLDVVYLVVGKLTRRLAQLPPGTALDVWGPLGNGFDAIDTPHLIMVAGGIGQTPFLALAQEAIGKFPFGLPARPRPKVGRITFCYGARSAEYLAGVDDFRRLGIEVGISTDDGSAGEKGLVTNLLQRALDQSTEAHVVSCGPERMLESVAKICSDRQVPCQVSLETPMACGIGICFSCVTRVKQPDGNWDYARTCVEGPVFDAAQIAWE